MRALGIALLAVAGCGDNSKVCGVGTADRDGDGECESLVPIAVCGNGTRVDPITHDCVPDPATCGGGTVLVHGHCQDPTAMLDIDLEEGPEPNGFEPGAVPAGVITLGANGFVIHGCITPLDDATPDFDVYTLDVDQPTLLSITADGVHGLAAGFQLTSSVLATWKRFGIDVATDTSKRQVFLPSAGRYRFIVADSRTLLPQVTGGTTVPPAGNPDGTSCYFATIDRVTPMPAPLSLATGASGMLGHDVKFFSASLSGAVPLTATIASPHAQASLVVMRNGALHAFDDDDGSLVVGGFASTDAALIVTDFVYNYALFTVPYTLTSP